MQHERAILDAKTIFIGQPANENQKGIAHPTNVDSPSFEVGLSDIVLFPVLKGEI